MESPPPRSKGPREHRDLDPRSFMLEIMLQATGGLTLSDGARTIGVKDATQAEIVLGLWGHPRPLWAPALQQVLMGETVVRLDWIEPLKPAEREEFKDRVHRLLDEPFSLSMSDIARQVHAQGTTHLKEMLAGAKIPRQHLLFLRGFMEKLPGAAENIGLPALPPTGAEVAPAPMLAAPPVPSEPAVELAGADDLGSPGSPIPVAPDSGVERAAGEPDEVQPPPPSGADTLTPELKEAVSAAAALPAADAPRPRSRRGFSVLVHWLQDIRGLSKEAVALAAGLSSASSLKTAVQATVSMEKVERLYGYVVDLGVDPDRVIEEHAPHVPSRLLPVEFGEDAPTSPSDSPARKEFVRIVKRLRAEPWAVDWKWFDAVLGYSTPKYTQRTFCTPGAAPDAQRMKKLRREHSRVLRSHPQPGREPQLRLLSEQGLGGAAAPVALPLPAPERRIATEEPLSPAAANPPSVETQVGSAAVPALGYEALSGLFAGAASDLQSACEKLEIIVQILPEMAGRPVAEFREGLIREIQRLQRS